MTSGPAAIKYAAEPASKTSARYLSNAVLGVILFIAPEIMFFAALMSAHTIARAAALGGVWPPAGQPRLPIEQTAVNTAALLASGLLLWMGNRTIPRDWARGLRLVAGSIALGIAFLVLQGREWAALIREGLTITASTHAAFFYTIVGVHALHVVIAACVMLVIYSRLKNQRLRADAFEAARIYWYFVVLLWPVLYLKVYYL